MSAAPALRVLSLGAGVQSTTLALLAVEGVLPTPDAAIFADTGWEPKAVYEHLARLTRVLDAAGIPTHRVRRGNIRDDHLDPGSPFSSMPLFVRVPPRTDRVAVSWSTCSAACGWTESFWQDIDRDDWVSAGGSVPDEDAPADCDVCQNKGVVPTAWEERETSPAREALGRRQCTHDYKLRPVRAKTRELLGYPHPQPVPRGVYAETWVGFSTDEVHRVNDNRSPRYARLTYPLLDLGMSRKDCARWLTARGWSTTKSACIGCPFHGNATWRRMRDEQPEEWADAVAFDAAIRNSPRGTRSQMRGEQYLHRSLLPLDQAPIDRVSRREWNDRQVDLLDVIAEEGDPDGCNPYGCRSGVPVEPDEGHTA